MALLCSACRLREASVRVMMRPGVYGIDQWMSRRDL